jgi:hypothetical protein
LAINQQNRFMKLGLLGLIAVGIIWGASLLLAPAPKPTSPALAPKTSSLSTPEKPLKQYPAILQPLEAHWRTQRSTAVNKGLYAKEVHFEVSDTTQKQWMLKGQEALYFPDNSGGAWLKQLSGQVFSKTGEPLATFSAPYGQFEASQQLIRLKGRATFTVQANR